MTNFPGTEIPRVAMPKKTLAALIGVHRVTLYRWMKKLEPKILEEQPHYNKQSTHVSEKTIEMILKENNII